MASNLLSRVLPPSQGGQSIYEAIRDQEEAAAEHSQSGNDRLQTEVDEQNLQERFHDEDVDLLAEAMGSRMNSESPELTGQNRSRRTSATERGTMGGVRPKWMRGDVERRGYRDEEVSPEMLLLEDHSSKRGDEDQQSLAGPDELPPPTPGPSNHKNRVQWNTARQQQKPYQGSGTGGGSSYNPVNALQFADPVDKAMWRWTNVQNLDVFFKDVYIYYIEKGIWSILLRRVIGVLTAAFVVALSVFMISCIDYSLIPESKRLSEVLVPKCSKNMSGFSNLLIWLFSFFWLLKVVSYVGDVRRLWHLHEFYTHLLQVPDVEIQTISWQEIVGRIMNLRDANPRTALNINRRSRKYIGEVTKESMDAHDIANRLMRKENYYIALFNKDILDCTIPLPGLRKYRLFSKSLEWNLGYCVSDFVFNEQGQVRQIFLKDTHRQALIDSLRTRFIVAGFINIAVAPIVVVSILVLYFLRYFTEFHKDPSQAGARGYTLFAEWKFREFNELHHLFQRRLNMSYPFASRYLDQFPKDKTVQLVRFVRTVAGALATVLGVAYLLDPDVSVGFEITPDRTVFFWLTILAGIWATARGMIPDDELVFDPEYAINQVAQYTHYQPAHWKGRLHSDEVRQEFSELYRNQIRIFLDEMLGIIVTPFVLWFSLPQCSEQIVDFFREFTVHVDGLGYVCWFAHFNFKKPGMIQPEQAGSGNAGQRRDAAGRGGMPEQDLRTDYYNTKEDKMMSSYYTFLDSYAMNPKRKDHVAHSTSRQHRNFHPPPAFPSLTSAPAQQGSQDDAAQVDRRFGPDRSVQSLSRHQTPPKFADPSPSLLLDPHHQPVVGSTALRRPHSGASPLAAGGAAPNAQAMSARLRSGAGRSRAVLAMTASSRIETDHPAGQGQQHGRSSTGNAAASDESGLMQGDSHMGDSWKGSREGVGRSKEYTDGEDGVAGSAEQEANELERLEEDGGVLGLLTQFTRAQTDGRGGGVGI